MAPLLVAASIATAPTPPPVHLGYWAARVAACESGERRPDGRAVPGTLDWTAQNPHSTASGAFQFLDSTWRSVTGRTDRAMHATPAAQVAAFEALWADGAGASAWDASRPCWGPS